MQKTIQDVKINNEEICDAQHKTIEEKNEQCLIEVDQKCTKNIEEVKKYVSNYIYLDDQNTKRNQNQIGDLEMILRSMQCQNKEKGDKMYCIEDRQDNLLRMKEIMKKELQGVENRLFHSINKIRTEIENTNKGFDI